MSELLPCTVLTIECECEVTTLKCAQMCTCSECEFYCYFCKLIHQLFVDVEGFL